MKNLRLLFPALLIAAVCGGGGYCVYQWQVRARERDRAAGEWSNGSSRSDAPSHTFARTRFRILKSWAPDPFGSTVPAVEAGMSANWMQSQIKSISSSRVLGPVVRRLNLETEWGLSSEQAIARLQEMMEVGFSEDTDVASVTVTGCSANTCADVSNAVRDVYEQLRKEEEEKQLKLRMQMADAEIEAMRETVDARKVELKALQKKHGIAETAPGHETSSHIPAEEYATALRQYDSSLMLLNTMRELAARQKVDEGVLKPPIETLEAARPGLPRTR